MVVILIYNIFYLKIFSVYIFKCIRLNSYRCCVWDWNKMTKLIPFSSLSETFGQINHLFGIKTKTHSKTNNLGVELLWKRCHVFPLST